jgi:uncharacterized protein (TIGR02147 family)
MPSIFEYLDYRKFLKDYYEERKRREPWFTHRYVASKIGFDSGYFTKLIQMKRQMSLKYTQKFIELLDLNTKEAQYFQSLIRFCRARTHEEKNHHFKELVGFKQCEKLVLSEQQYALFSNWYNLVIREILAYYPFDGDYQALAKMVNPAILPKQAKKAVKLLESLNLIRKGQSGCYKLVSPVWTTGEEVTSLAVINYQKSAMEIASGAYDRCPPDKRSMSTLTISISEKEYKEIEEEIRALRDRILAAARNCQKPDRVYQCNFAIFPVTTLKKNPGNSCDQE